MRAGDFEMADFEAHMKTYKNSFVTYEISPKPRRDAEVRENLSVPSQKVFVSTKYGCSSLSSQVKSEKLLAEYEGLRLCL